MPETMTPRERVEATIHHREPDRVPITLGGSANHLSEERFNVLREHFGFEGYGCGLCQTGVPCESGIPVRQGAERSTK